AQTGGGIAWFDAAQIINTVFISNGASYGGGGLFSFTAAVSGSQFIGNHAITGAGGLSTKLGGVLTNTDFIGNGATLGSGALEAYILTITGGTFQGNHSDADGGAIGLSGPGLVSGASFAGNSASGNGGAIFAGTFSNLTLRDSTLSGNHAGADGGGLRNQGLLTLTNSTLSGNSAAGGGGLSNYQGQARLSFVTLSGNTAITGGGLSQYALIPGQTITLSATILADSASGGNCDSSGGTVAIVSNNHNLSSDATCSAALSQPQDQNDTPALLGALAANGGPTLTHLPASNSPAIDAAGTAGCPAFDQRGVARPHPAAGSCDIGAVEVNEYKLYLPLAINTAPAFITYRNFEIVPVSSTIKVGTTVIFNIEGGLHEPYSTTPPYNFDSGPNLGPGSTYAFTFNQAGTITLLCGYHANMTATLVIEP
ncbi:MAG: choice-of-anchor Q domain-containing protein, partial [Anaerolineales bacterium]